MSHFRCFPATCTFTLSGLEQNFKCGVSVGKLSSNVVTSTRSFFWKRQTRSAFLQIVCRLFGEFILSNIFVQSTAHNVEMYETLKT